MAKKKELDWDTARILFELDKPLGEIEKKTGINRGSISRKAKKDGWVRGSATPVAQVASDVEAFKATLTQPQLHVFNEDVIQRTEFATRLGEFSEKVMNKADKLIDVAENGQDFKAIIDGVDKHSVTVGFNQRHANSQVNIQNTNAQQNNEGISEEVESSIRRVLLGQ